MYSVPIDPVFLNQCCIHLPYSKFSIKKGHCSLAVVQIYLDKFISLRYGPFRTRCLLWKVLCPVCTKPPVPVWPAPFKVPVSSYGLLGSCWLQTHHLYRFTFISTVCWYARWTGLLGGFFALLKCAAFCMSLPFVFCILSLGLPEMSAPWGGPSALLFPFWAALYMCLCTVESQCLRGLFLLDVSIVSICVHTYWGNNSQHPQSHFLLEGINRTGCCLVVWGDPPDAVIATTVSQSPQIDACPLGFSGPLPLLADYRCYPPLRRASQRLAFGRVLYQFTILLLYASQRYWASYKKPLKIFFFFSVLCTAHLFLSDMFWNFGSTLY